MRNKRQFARVSGIAGWGFCRAGASACQPRFSPAWVQNGLRSISRLRSLGVLFFEPNRVAGKSGKVFYERGRGQRAQLG
jgi:hypothetical protein